MAGIRVVLDTNVRVSDLANPTSIPARIVTAWRQGSVNVALSHCILDEMARVLPRPPRLAQTPDKVRDLIGSFMFLADSVEPAAAHETQRRDPRRSARSANACCGPGRLPDDRDTNLLALADRYPVLSPWDFWANHGS